MRKLCYIAIAAITMAFTTQAEASEAFQPYIGVGFSSISMDLSTFNGGGWSGFQNVSAIGYTIKGGVDIQRYFGLEVRMFNSGSATSTGTVFGNTVNVSAKVNSGFAYFAKLQIPFENGFNAYALLGQSTANLTLTVQELGQTFTSSGNGSSSSEGLGLGYTKNNNVFEVEWMTYASDVSALSLFVGHKF